jgi:uncharacterized membrane protein YedE/YeeE
MAALLLALLAGLLFGLGLTVSGMVDPARVLGFLDVAGAWNPTLAFELAAAVIVAGAGFALARWRARPLLEPTFHAPTRTGIDGRLVGGALIFGVGWGMVGYCPGPALAALALGRWPTVQFVLAMLAGMVLFEIMEAPPRRRLIRPARR